MKLNSEMDEMITLGADLNSANNCYYLSLKADQEETTLAKVLVMRHDKAVDVNVADLDARYEPDSSEDEEDDAQTKELNKKIKRPGPDGEFLPIQIGDGSDKTMQIGVDLLDDVKK